MVEQVYDWQQCDFVTTLCAVLVLEEGSCHACCEGISAACRHLQDNHAVIKLIRSFIQVCVPLDETWTETALPCSAQTALLSHALVMVE